MQDRHASRFIELDAAGFVILLDVLHDLSWRGNWNADGDDLTDEQWDTAENWVAGTALALMTIVECEEDEEPEEGDVSYAVMQDQKSSGVQGGASVGATWVGRTINTEVYDPDSIVTISGNKFTPIEGTFEAFITTATNSASGESRLRLYNVTQASVVMQGLNAFDEDAPTLAIPFDANGSDEYRVDHRTEIGHANGLGSSLGTGDNEVFLTILLEMD